MVDVRMTMDEYLTLLGGIPMDSTTSEPSVTQGGTKEEEILCIFPSLQGKLP